MKRRFSRIRRGRAESDQVGDDSDEKADEERAGGSEDALLEIVRFFFSLEWKT